MVSYSTRTVPVAWVFFFLLLGAWIGLDCDCVEGLIDYMIWVSGPFLYYVGRIIPVVSQGACDGFSCIYHRTWDHANKMQI